MRDVYERTVDLLKASKSDRETHLVMFEALNDFAIHYVHLEERNFLASDKEGMLVEEYPSTRKLRGRERLCHALASEEDSVRALFSVPMIC